jgi:hypothetical protein
VSAEHVAYLDALARRVAAPFVDAGAVAAMIVGSTAKGMADEWSDLDLILFYEAWPGRTALDGARRSLAPGDVVTLGGDLDGEVYLEQMLVGGVACQLVHQTTAAWHETAAVVLEQLDVESPVQKALSGLHEGVPIHGEEIIASLRAEAAYPERLRVRMIEANLGVFPLWRLQDGLACRDAELWQRSELVAGLQRILAVLAGVNAVWFSGFQLKQVRTLAASFRVAPAGLAERIDAALVAPMPAAAFELERLLDETLAIVEAEVPSVDVTAARRGIGARTKPWSPPAS